MWDSPSQRPEHFSLNPYSSLSEGLVFAGLGGGGCAGSLRYEDSSWYEKHGTLTNMDPVTDWVWDSTLDRFVIDMDGSSDFIAIPRITMPHWTFSLWVKLASNVTSDAGIFGYDGAFQRWLDVLDGNVWRIAVQAGVVIYGNTSLDLRDTLAYVTCTYDGSQIRLYLNGAADGATAVANGTVTTDIIGSTGPTVKKCTGQITDPLIYNRALSPSEIRELADPSNHMLSGLILPPKRKYYRAAPIVDYDTRGDIWCTSNVGGTAKRFKIFDYSASEVWA